MVARTVRTGTEVLHEEIARAWKGRLGGKSWMINYEVFMLNFIKCLSTSVEMII